MASNGQPLVCNIVTGLYISIYICLHFCSDTVFSVMVDFAYFWFSRETQDSQ